MCVQRCGIKQIYNAFKGTFDSEAKRFRKATVKDETFWVLPMLSSLMWSQHIWGGVEWVLIKPRSKIQVHMVLDSPIIGSGQGSRQDVQEKERQPLKEHDLEANTSLHWS